MTRRVPSGQRMDYSDFVAEYEKYPGRWETRSSTAQYGSRCSTASHIKYMFEEQCQHVETQPGYLVQCIYTMSPFARYLCSDANDESKEERLEEKFGRFPIRSIRPYEVERCRELHKQNDRRKEDFQARFAMLPRLADVHVTPERQSILQPVSQFESLLQWAETYARTKHGIVPPYLKEGFAAVSVLPQLEPARKDEVVHEGSDESECDNEELGLSPLRPQEPQSGSDEEATRYDHDDNDDEALGPDDDFPW